MANPAGSRLVVVPDADGGLGVLEEVLLQRRAGRAGPAGPGH